MPNSSCECKICTNVALKFTAGGVKIAPERALKLPDKEIMAQVDKCHPGTNAKVHFKEWDTIKKNDDAPRELTKSVFKAALQEDVDAARSHTADIVAQYKGMHTHMKLMWILCY